MVHEVAHALAVVAQGGRVTRFDVIPGGEPVFTFGGVGWDPSGDESILLIAIAPTLLWTVIAITTAACGFLAFRADRISRLALLLGLFLPLVDASLSAAGLFMSSPTADWSVAFAGWEVLVAVGFAGYVAVFGEVGLRLFQRCWPDALSPAEFTLGYLLMLGLPWIRYILG